MSCLIEPLDRRVMLASISGTIFNDRDNDGVFDSSPDLPWPNVTVYLEANDNAQLDGGEQTTVSGSFTSGMAGRYRFDNLGAGTFRVRVVPPANFVQTFPANGAAQVVTITNPALSALNVHVGGRDATQSSRIAGRAYADANGNGARDAGEPVLAGVLTWADLNHNAAQDAGEPTSTTSATGVFDLTVPNPSYTTTYHVRAVAPAGLTQTAPTTNGGAFVITLDAGVGILPTDVFGFADGTPPAVTQGRLRYETAPHRIRFDLTEPTVNGHWTVGFALSVTRLDGGPAIPPGAFNTFSIDGGALTYTANPQVLPGGVLPDGRYRAGIPGGTLRDAAGNTQDQPFSFEFTFLRGDATGDGLVNLADFNRLASNFGQPNRTFSQGDFNYDGAVNLADFNILAGRFGSAVAPPAAARPGATTTRATDMLNDLLA